VGDIALCNCCHVFDLISFRIWQRLPDTSIVYENDALVSDCSVLYSTHIRLKPLAHYTDEKKPSERDGVAVIDGIEDPEFCCLSALGVDRESMPMIGV
jgi:hypothetical protein